MDWVVGFEWEGSLSGSVIPIKFSFCPYFKFSFIGVWLYGRVFLVNGYRVN